MPATKRSASQVKHMPVVKKAKLANKEDCSACLWTDQDFDVISLGVSAQQPCKKPEHEIIDLTDDGPQVPICFREMKAQKDDAYAPRLWIPVDVATPHVDLGPPRQLRLADMDPKGRYNFYQPFDPDWWGDSEPADEFDGGKLTVSGCSPLRLVFLTPLIEKLDFVGQYSDALEQAGAFIRRCPKLISLRAKGALWFDFSFDIARCPLLRDVDISTEDPIPREFFQDLVNHFPSPLDRLRISWGDMTAHFDMSDTAWGKLKVNELTLLSTSRKLLPDLFARLPSSLQILNIERGKLPLNVVPAHLTVNEI
jgi:hypothetical protein